MPNLELGRDVGCELSAEDFDLWVAFVNARIDERCGFSVTVSERGPRDVQSDAITGADDAQRETIERVKQDIWNDFCADGR